MTTMTCSQLGGACDVAHAGEDANEIIHAQDQHLREAVAAGSSEHADISWLNYAVRKFADDLLYAVPRSLSGAAAPLQTGSNEQ